MRKTTGIIALVLLLALVSACGDRTFSVSVDLGETETASAALPLPPTWTPSPTSLPRATLTPFPTYTSVPALTAFQLPTSDPFQELGNRSAEVLLSPNGQWSADIDSFSMRVVNPSTDKVWTLPCALFEECGVITPVKWSSDSNILYFAPEAYMDTPVGIRLYTAIARIDVETGQWEKILEETNRYYDFAVSNDDTYLAYTLPAATFADNSKIILSIRQLKNGREDRFTLDGFVGGNIVWSPFTNRFVFQIQDPASRSSIVYYDVETGVLKYIVREQPNLFYLTSWGEDNLIAMWKISGTDRTYWVLNPFSNEITPIPTPD